MRLVIVVALVAIEDRKLLIVRTDDLWTLPGGHREPAEDDLMCLYREIREELPELSVRDVRFFCTVEGRTPRSDEPLRLFAYRATAEGPITPGSEVVEAVWTPFPSPYPLAEPTERILAALHESGLVG
ncbi:MAG: NUDIX domain-containing protein [Patescibacteria group bacterium]|nr:NUDIX domain-containing protein [Patescibacteria group bacterium]